MTRPGSLVADAGQVSSKGEGVDLIVVNTHTAVTAPTSASRLGGVDNPQVHFHFVNFHIMKIPPGQRLGTAWAADGCMNEPGVGRDIQASTVCDR